MDWIWNGLQQEGIGLVQKNFIGFLDFTDLWRGGRGQRGNVGRSARVSEHDPLENETRKGVLSV